MWLPHCAVLKANNLIPVAVDTRSGVRKLRRDVQGLRSIAVLTVIIFHVNKDWLPGGFVGVDIFFAISGYLISKIIIEQKKCGLFSLSDFYFSRVKRILPAYCFFLAVSALVFSVLFIPTDYERFLDSLKSGLLFISNRFFSRQADYFAPAGYETPLVHTWSLAVEMQFYLFLPLLLVYLPARVFRPVALIFIVGGMSYSTYKIGLGLRQEEYFSLLSRTPEFLVGGMLAVLPAYKEGRRYLRESLAILGLLLIAASCLLINEKSTFPGWLTLFPTVGAVLIIAAERSAVNSILSSNLMVLLGDLSYSLYLWHWPVLAGLRYYYESYYLSGNAIVLFSLLTAGLSGFSLRYVEAPFRRGKFDIRNVFRIASLAVVVGGAVWAASWMNKKLVAPLPVALTRYASVDDICHEKIVGECLRGDISSKRTVLMVGDSHAAQLNHFADEIGREVGVAIRVISASSCVTIPGFDWERLPEWAQKTCRNHINYAAQYLGTVDTVIIAGMWQYHVGSMRFISALDTYVRSATGNNQKVIVLAQVPMLTTNVQRVHRFDSLGIRSRDATIHHEWVAANEVVRKIVTSIPNALFVDFSNGEVLSSPPFYEGALIYRDDNHLNEVGSTLLGKHAVHVFVGLMNDARDGARRSSESIR